MNRTALVLVLLLVVVGAAHGKLILHYQFDESGGTVVSDSSDSGLDGILDGPTSNWDPCDGYYDGCLIFNDNMAVLVPDTTLAGIDDEITVSVWLYGYDSTGRENWVFDTGSGVYNLSGIVPTIEEEVYFRAGAVTSDELWWSNSEPSDWLDSWRHYAFVKEEGAGFMKIYRDGQLVASGTGVSSSLGAIGQGTFKIGATVSHNNDYKGKMDDLRIYDHALSASQVMSIFTGTAFTEATNPSPGDGASEVCPDVRLWWRPGGLAASHDVYLGSDYDDVNDADTATAGIFKNNYIMDANVHVPAAPLSAGTTYYWRVDVVNDANVESPWKGQVWSFAVEDGNSRNPEPSDGAFAVPTNKVLSWTPSCQALAHDVYFGTSFDDVNSAANPYVLPGRGRIGVASFEPGTLDSTVTYYWRIDEVTTGGINRGDVWSFSVIDSFVNSVGMEMLRVGPGTFSMGSSAGDFDEEPIHEVTITQAFHVSRFEVTNAQYEQFDPNHAFVDHRGFSHGPNEAVIFVSWEDANAFCDWLSVREGGTYRLPTEAEWEYACRAGTTSEYHTGDTLGSEYLNHAVETQGPYPVSLLVGQSPANPWGLHDMHGNVEEWCYDWYGPYDANDQNDPVGRVDGDFRVCRGGSHSTTVEYLRSANRMGTLPQDNHWLIGFRVVAGELPDSTPLPKVGPEPYQIGVSQSVPADINDGPDANVPYFYGPRRYVYIPGHLDGGPLFSNHNHVPAIVQCPNGDLLTVWYSTIREKGRYLAIAASRLRYGSDQWEEASLFWNGPDRNDHASAMWVDETGRIYHFNGLGDAATWGALATVVRTSDDSGVTWSQARLIMPEHTTRQMPIETVFRTSGGSIILPCDAVTGGAGGSVLWISDDDGLSWTDPGAGRPSPVFDEGLTGAWIAGIHAGIAELGDGSLLAYGRGNNINDMMPMSVSSDMGDNWTYWASEFQPIGGGKRLILLRLAEGPLLFCSYASGMSIEDESGSTRSVSGLFAAVSFDDGLTWPYKRLVSDDGPGRSVETMDGTLFTMGYSTAEPRGYLSVHQARNGIIHLISSRQHYEFNYKWLTTRPPEVPEDPNAAPLPEKGILADVFDMTDYPSSMAGWRWTGSGVDEADAVSFPEPGVILIDTGDDQRARWANDAVGGFGDADELVGYTVEIRLKIVKSTGSSRGIDVEGYTGDGSASGDRSFVTITDTGVYWFDGSFAALAEGLDNSNEMHTYRMAVLPDKTVQIYRDRELLATRQASNGVDPLISVSGPYLQWGDGAGGSETDAEIDYISYDPGGPYAPSEICRDFVDFAQFCTWWLSPCDSGNDWCDGYDAGRSSRVDAVDFAKLAPRWLGYCP